MSVYKWANNQMKLQRAIAQARHNQTEDETSIRALYVSYGGLINRGCEEVTDETSAMEVSSEIEELAHTIAEEVAVEMKTEPVVINRKPGKPKKDAK